MYGDLAPRSKPEDKTFLKSRVISPFLRYNIAPSQQVPVIVRTEERNILKPMRWGLVPSWTEDKALWQRLINARAETLRERPCTSGSFQRSVV
jgi:putative SOS response-associated peptidase YedK